MQYRRNPKNGDEISILGHGGMHFQKDENAMIDQLRFAIDSGVNYIDTAYIYPGSEVTIGKALQGGYRDRVSLADKLPPYLVRKYADFDRVFGKQLERLQTNRIDYYMVHMLPNAAEFARLCALGLLDWVAQKREQGIIRNFGFSYHGGVPEFQKLIDCHSWDFCMIQYNYYDENAQAGKSGLLYAAQKGIPVIAMEPLRGGSLVTKLPEEGKKLWENASPQRSPAEWALRWVWNHPEVLCLLSGMHDRNVLEENLRIAQDAKANDLTAEQLALFAKVRKTIADKTRVPCTGCSYCMPCPAGVDIPMCFSTLNDSALGSKMNSQVNYIMRNFNHEASKCSDCGKCEQHCPQAIPVREKLREVKKTFEGPIYKPMRFAIKTVMRLK